MNETTSQQITQPIYFNIEMPRQDGVSNSNSQMDNNCSPSEFQFKITTKPVMESKNRVAPTFNSYKANQESDSLNCSKSIQQILPSQFYKSSFHMPPFSLQYETSHMMLPQGTCLVYSKYQYSELLSYQRASHMVIRR